MEICLRAQKNHFVPVCFLLGLALQAGAVWTYLHHQPALLCTGVAAVGALLFILAYELSIHGNYMVSLDSSGLLDTRLGIGKINWSDIDHVNLELNYGHRALSFRVRRADLYLQRLTPLRRAQLLGRRKLGFRRFTVDLRGLDIDPIFLKGQINSIVAQSAAPARPDVMAPLSYV